MTSMALARKEYGALFRYCVSSARIFNPSSSTGFCRQIFTNSLPLCRILSPTTAVVMYRPIASSIQVYQPPKQNMNTRAGYVSKTQNQTEKSDKKSFVLVHENPMDYPTISLLLTMVSVVFTIHQEQFPVETLTLFLDQHLDLLQKVETCLANGNELMVNVVLFLNGWVKEFPKATATILQSLLITNGLVKLSQFLFSKKPGKGSDGSANTGEPVNGSPNTGGAPLNVATAGVSHFDNVYVYNPIIHINNVYVYNVEKMK